MVQPILALFKEFRPEARHDALARELRYAAVGVREGFDEVLSKAIEFRVSTRMKVSRCELGVM